jgi:hypothetical protein
MTKMIQTPSGDYVHPQDFVRRRRWAGSRTSPALLAASYASEDASSEPS